MTKVALIDKSALDASSNTQSETISKSLEAFAQRHGLALLLDSISFKSAILTSADGVDLTRTFIAESKQNSSAAPAAVPDTTNSKIAFVMTEDFYDKKSGIKGLANLPRAAATKTLDRKVLDALARFAELNGITTILDATGTVGIISASESLDVTRAFIAFYNGGAATSSTKLTIPDARVAIMNSDSFVDQNTGITMLVQAMNRVDREFLTARKELEDMKARLETLSGQQRKDLSDEFQKKGQKAQAAYQKRLEKAIGPIYNEIGKTVDQFAQDRGINLVLDSAKVTVVWSTSSIDKTTSFIAEYNQHHPK